AINLACRIRRVVPADAYQARHPELVERVEHILHARFGLGRVGPRGPQDRTATQMDAFDAIDRKSEAMLRVALGQPFVAVAKADHFILLVDALDGRGADDAVDARRRPAANQNSQLSPFLFVAHTL